MLGMKDAGTGKPDGWRLVRIPSERKDLSNNAADSAAGLSV